MLSCTTASFFAILLLLFHYLILFRTHSMENANLRLLNFRLRAIRSIMLLHLAVQQNPSFPHFFSVAFLSFQNCLQINDFSFNYTRNEVNIE